MNVFDDDEPGIAAEQTERVARRDGFEATHLLGVQYLDRPVVEAIAQPFEGDANLRSIAPHDQVERLECARHRGQA